MIQLSAGASSSIILPRSPIKICRISSNMISIADATAKDGSFDLSSVEAFYMLAQEANFGEDDLVIVKLDNIRVSAAKGTTNQDVTETGVNNILPLAEIPCEIYETLDYTLRKEPGGQEGWKTLKIGDEWGEERGYAWLRGDITISSEWAGKELWLKSGADATECLLFLDGKPSGIFYYTEEVAKPWERVHVIQPLMQSAIPGKTIHIALEAYAGHKVLGNVY